MNRRAGIGLGIVAVGVIVLLLATRGADDPEMAVRRMILEARDAAERQDLGGVLEHVSERFRGRAGTGRDELKGYLFVQLRRGTWRKVFIVDMEVEIAPGSEPSTGTVQMRVVLASADAIGSLQQALAANAGVWRLALEVAREEDDAWRVTGAEWERVSASELVVPSPR